MADLVGSQSAPEPLGLERLIAGDARMLSRQLAALRGRLFAPTTRKTLRPFTGEEAAGLLGIDETALRALCPDADAPLSDQCAPDRSPRERTGRRRSYTLAEINRLRRLLPPAHRPPGRGAGGHLQVIAVTNFKGGSGKTTTAAHLGQYLALRGYRVLAIDLDPQASLSTLFGYQPEIDMGENDTLYGALRYDDRVRPMRAVIRPTYFDGLDLVPGNLELQEFEHETPRMLMRGRRPGDGPFFARIATALADVASDYDVVVVDCPPQLGFLTLAALCAATGVLVTVHPQMLDIASMSQFLHMTSDLLAVVARAGGRLELDFLRYVVTRHEPRDGPQTEMIGFLRSLFGERVLTRTMLKSTAVADAGLTKQTLYEIGRQGMARATYGRALEALDAVNGEIEALVRAAWAARAAPSSGNPARGDRR